MDFFEAQEFFQKQYPNKEIKYEFDDSCHRFNEMVFTDGLPNMIHHIECRKVKVTPEGMDSFYASISPHRMAVSWVDMKKIAEAQLLKTDVHINDEFLKELASLKDENELETSMNEVIKMCGISKFNLKKKIETKKNQMVDTVH